MRILVTGATGFIGRHLATGLAQDGHEVICLVRDERRLSVAGTRGIRPVVGDLLDRESLRIAVDDAEIVFHLAGLTKALSPGVFTRVNRLGTRRLVEACVETCNPPRRFVYVSSLSAMGPCGRRDTLVEDSYCHPLTPYGRSKLAGEDELRTAGAGLAYTILRPPAVYGPGDRENLAFFRMAKLGVVPIVAGAGRFTLIHVADLTRAVRQCTDCDAAIGKTILVGSPQAVTWRELAEAIRLAVNPRARTVEVPRKAVRFAGRVVQCFSRFAGIPVIFDEAKAIEMTQDAWVCSGARAAELLGFRCQVALSQGFMDTADWYRRAGWL
ncbi:MAG: NAD(P)-dependent oxidoreductase [Planctomycetota bacterium]|nr:NAD(P)-dependent oxidoreductase [Planctomycetota bacterium]